MEMPHDTKYGSKGSTNCFILLAKHIGDILTLNNNVVINIATIRSTYESKGLKDNNSFSFFGNKNR